MVAKPTRWSESAWQASPAHEGTHAQSRRRRQYAGPPQCRSGRAFVTIALIAILFPWFPGALDLSAGSTASRTIVAPRETTYESAVLTEQLRRQAAAAVQPVMVSDTEVRGMFGVEAYTCAFVPIGFTKMLERLIVARAVIEHLAEREVQIDFAVFGYATRI